METSLAPANSRVSAELVAQDWFAQSTQSGSHIPGGAPDVINPRRTIRIALAERLAGLPPLAVQGTKRALNEVLRHRFAEVMPISLANELTSLGSDDLREAIAAFKERRTPTYAGR